MNIGQGRTISIVGAGISGLAAACSLVRLGYRINIYERGDDPRRSGPGTTEPASVLLAPRGRETLRTLGVEDAALKHGVALDQQLLHRGPAKGRAPRASLLGALGDGSMSVPLAAIRESLLAEAERHEEIEIFFGERCVEHDAEAASLRFADPGISGPAPGLGDAFVASSLVIGADGPDSVVRRGMQSIPGLSFSQRYHTLLCRQARLMPLAAQASTTPALNRTSAHVWSAGGVVIAALPRTDGSWDCSVLSPIGPDGSIDSLHSSPRAEAAIRAAAPILLELDPGFTDALAAATVRRILTTRAAPWTHTTPAGVGIALLGSAGHACVPMLGLEVNESLEDAAALAGCIERASGDMPLALAEFERCRRHNAEAFAESLAKMLSDVRERGSSRLVRARATVERTLHEMFPRFLAPRTSVLAASGGPFAQASKRAERLERVLRGLGVGALIIVLFLLVLLRVPVWPLLVGVILTTWGLWEVARSRPSRRAAAH